jgi:hypothetical protein
LTNSKGYVNIDLLIKNKNMPYTEQLHDSRFDPIRDEAYRFTSQGLGLDVAPINNIALLNSEQAKALHDSGMLGDKDNHGGYDMRTNTMVVDATPGEEGPISDRIAMGSKTVHELVHSGTVNIDEHTFYNEALAGIGEYKYLEWLKDHGIYRPSIDFLLQRAGVVLWVPGQTRYVDAREAYNLPGAGDKGAKTSQGLIAAVGLNHGLINTGLTSKELFGMSSRNGTAQFKVMKESVESIQPGLAKEIEKVPGTTDGMIQAADIIHTAARKQQRRTA